MRALGERGVLARLENGADSHSTLWSVGSPSADADAHAHRRLVDASPFGRVPTACNVALQPTVHTGAVGHCILRTEPAPAASPKHAGNRPGRAAWYGSVGRGRTAAGGGARGQELVEGEPGASAHGTARGRPLLPSRVAAGPKYPHAQQPTRQPTAPLPQGPTRLLRLTLWAQEESARRLDAEERPRRRFGACPRLLSPPQLAHKKHRCRAPSRRVARAASRWR